MASSVSFASLLSVTTNFGQQLTSVSLIKLDRSPAIDIACAIIALVNGGPRSQSSSGCGLSNPL